MWSIWKHQSWCWQLFLTCSRSHKTATSIDSRRQLQQATLCKYQNCLEWVGSCLQAIGNVVAFGALCDMMLDIVVLQLVGLLLAISPCQLCHEEVCMKGLVQGSIMTHPCGRCASVLSMTSVHVCRAANVPSVIHYAFDAVNIECLAS